MTIRTYHATDMPAGTVVSPRPGLAILRHPDSMFGLPWKNYPEGPRSDHAEVDRMIAQGAEVVLPGRGATRPLLDVLRAGLDWLYRVQQPDTAVVTHHGYLCRVGDRTLTFAPYAQPLVVAKVVDPETPYGGQHEVALMAAILEAEFGRPVAESWNGLGSVHMATYRLFDAIEGTSLWEAHRRYMAGCPRHAQVFCGQSMGCPWLKAGFAAVVEPAWPTVPDAPERVTVDA